MNLTCPNGHALTVADPTSPTPGGTMSVTCNVCGASFEAKNPMGDETFTFTEEAFLFPVLEKVPGARGTERRDLTRYEMAEPGEPGSIRFAPGEKVQARLLPSGFTQGPAMEEGEADA